MSKIVLASGSPRRREIMESFDLNFDIKSADIDEKICHGENPYQAAMALAFEKALAVSEICELGDIIIAADTIVLKDEILGKPKDKEDALRMLKLLQGDVHEVITGLAVIQAGTNKKIVSFEKTKVKIKQLTDELIKRYIDTGEVWDKAGSYAIQGKGAAIVEKIEGDYFNVVGMPISKLQNILSKFFEIELL